MQAILRRTAGDLPGDVLRYGDLVLDEARHEVFRGETRVQLTATEFALLRFFLLNPRRVLSKGQILQNVWRYDFGGNSNVVETYVSYLRRKLDAPGPPLIKTVRQAGYMLEALAPCSGACRCARGSCWRSSCWRPSGSWRRTSRPTRRCSSFLVDRTDSSLEESAHSLRERRRAAATGPSGRWPSRCARLDGGRPCSRRCHARRVPGPRTPPSPKLPDDDRAAGRDDRSEARALLHRPRRRTASATACARRSRTARARCSSSRRRSPTSTRRSTGCSLIELIVTALVLGGHRRARPVARAARAPAAGRHRRHRGGDRGGRPLAQGRAGRGADRGRPARARR